MGGSMCAYLCRTCTVFVNDSQRGYYQAFLSHPRQHTPTRCYHTHATSSFIMHSLSLSLSLISTALSFHLQLQFILRQTEAAATTAGRSWSSVSETAVTERAFGCAFNSVVFSLLRELVTKTCKAIAFYVCFCPQLVVIVMEMCNL